MLNVSYPKLSNADKQHVINNLKLRRARYVKHVLEYERVNLFKAPWKVVIVGDRPGPAAPTDTNYHHTPFYSIKHCSGWVNALLHLSGIKESDLIWINAYDEKGTPRPYEILERIIPVFGNQPCPVIALGGNAEKWLKKDFWDFCKVDHPQYHKRFKNGETYELPQIIRELSGEEPENPWA